MDWYFDFSTLISHNFRTSYENLMRFVRSHR